MWNWFLLKKARQPGQDLLHRSYSVLQCNYHERSLRPWNKQNVFHSSTDSVCKGNTKFCIDETEVRRTFILLKLRFKLKWMLEAHSHGLSDLHRWIKVNIFHLPPVKSIETCLEPIVCMVVHLFGQKCSTEHDFLGNTPNIYLHKGILTIHRQPYR